MRIAVEAADYSPGEADQLRRDMAAWRRSGRIEAHQVRFIAGMQRKGVAAEFAQRVFDQIRGFGEYGFPESHAMSFALIAYATSYLRRHYLPEFTCSLINAQPMGFYSVATIVGDAQRHGLEVRPIDVTASDWECTLEPVPHSVHGHPFAVRMGLRWVRGITARDGAAIVEARRAQPFESLGELVRRVQLSRGLHAALAESGALGALAPTRRDALWQVAGWVRRREDALPVDDDGLTGDVELAPLARHDEIFWDYRTSYHSTRGHPLEPFRDELRRRRCLDARGIARCRDGDRVEYIGMVICRQQPGTAGGVIFMTMEDETGFVNLVVWQRVQDAYREVMRTSSLLGVSGKLQIQESVVHLIAEHLWIPTLSRPVIEIESRDFH